jgi:hypothetical protein
MSSYISSSDASPPAAWRRWLAVFCAVLIGAGAAVYLFLVLLDPYDTGRFPAFGIKGVVDDNPLTANASRGRDPDFDAAVIGSSTGQMLDPSRLGSATGLNFVQLTMAGTGPREQLAVMQWFTAQHPRVGALVLVIDHATWCSQDAALPVLHPFPFWLYETDAEYLRNLMSERSLRHAFRRIGIALGLNPRSVPNGYSDYEAGRTWNFHPPAAPTAARPQAVPTPGLAFPAFERLRASFDRLPSVPFVMVVPPLYAGALPPAGSAEAGKLAACKAAAARLMSQRPGGHFLDFQTDDAVTRDPKNFMDTGHYRADLARKMEESIAAAVTSARKPPPEPAAGGAPVNR